MLSLPSFYRAMDLVEKTNGEFSYKFYENEYENFIDLIKMLGYPMSKGWYRHEKKPLLIYIDPVELKIIKD